MTDVATNVAKALLDIDAVGFVDEPIEFKSGMLAPVYTDNRKLPSYPGKWRAVVEGFAKIIEEQSLEFDFIAGVEAAGIPHSSALGFHLSKPSVFVRKKAKGHGTKKMVEGGDVKGKKVLLVEDLVTTGGSSLDAIEAVRSEDAEVTGCLVVVTYGFPESLANYEKAGVNLYPLTPFDTILDEAVERGLVTKEKAADVRLWRDDPWAWTENHK